MNCWETDTFEYRCYFDSWPASLRVSHSLRWSKRRTCWKMYIILLHCMHATCVHDAKILQIQASLNQSTSRQCLSLGHEMTEPGCSSIIMLSFFLIFLCSFITIFSKRRFQDVAVTAELFFSYPLRLIESVAITSNMRHASCWNDRLQLWERCWAQVWKKTKIGQCGRALNARERERRQRPALRRFARFLSLSLSVCQFP